MLAVITVVVLIPAGVALYHSFTDWRPGGESPWIGLANYREFLSNPVTGEIVENTAVLLIGVPLWTALPLVLAFALHERTPATGVFQAIFFFPAVLSPAIIGIMFRGILAPEGLVNEVLLGLGIVSEPVLWLDNAALVKPTLILVLAWASVGAGTVIFSAAMTSIDKHLLEAAKLDGAELAPAPALRRAARHRERRRVLDRLPGRQRVPLRVRVDLRAHPRRARLLVDDARLRRLPERLHERAVRLRVGAGDVPAR